MRRRYRAVHPNGKVFTRSTESRVYTHCVVAHRPERPCKWNANHPWPEDWIAEWAGSRALAEKNAARRRRLDAVDEVVILDAEEVS